MIVGRDCFVEANRFSTGGQLCTQAIRSSSKYDASNFDGGGEARGSRLQTVIDASSRLTGIADSSHGETQRTAARDPSCHQFVKMCLQSRIAPESPGTRSTHGLSWFEELGDGSPGSPTAADARPFAKTTSANAVQCTSCGLQSVYVDPKANGRYTLKMILMIDKNGLG